MRSQSAIIVVAIAALFPLITSSRIYRNPDVLARIPHGIKDSIDHIVSEKLQRTIATHFYDEEIIFNQPQEVVHSRSRRDVNDTVETVYSDWTEFGECSAKCGGGMQVRMRSCLKGNCTDDLINNRECGYLPCVAGTFVLTEISAFSVLPISDAKFLKFFDIKGLKYFGYITETRLYIFKWNPLINTFVSLQNIDVTEGISFDIMNTHPRTYLVVIEKATSVFPGRFSKMYYYDPFNMNFQTSQAVSFHVWNPSSVKTFEVYGKPFMALVNYESKEEDGYQQEQVICNAQTRSISCPIGTIITVQNVMYGRVSSWECSTGVDPFLAWNQYFTYCVVPGAKSKVSQICDNKQSCTLSANPSLLTDFDPCVQTNKYLKVTFTCGRISFLGQPVIYAWDGIGLSIVSGDKLVTSGPKDLEAFSIHNQQYLAVANYINNQRSHHLDSEIYMYNLLSGRFQSLQKLRTNGAVDMEFFKIGEGLAQEYFLAVANHVKILPNGVTTYEVDSVIYKWNWNLFVPFQCMKTYGAKKWTAIAGLNGEFVLSITNLYGNTTFYGYDGWRFYETKVQPKGDIFSHAESINTYLQYNQPMIIVKNNNSSNTTKNLYQVNFLKTFPKYELLESTLSIVQKLNRTVYEELIPSAAQFNATYTSKKSSIVFIDEDDSISDHKTFENIVVLQDTFIESATVKTVNLSPLDLEYERRQNYVNITLEEQTVNIMKASKLLSTVVTKSTPQTINATLTLHGNTTIQHIYVENNFDVEGTINDVDLSELRDNALFLNENSTIEVTAQFKNIVFDNDVTVSELIDDVNPHDFISIDRDEIVTGSKTFSQANFQSSSDIKNIQVDGFLNDVRLQDMFTVRGDQLINAPYTFNNTVVLEKDFNIQEHINGINIDDIKTNTIMLTEQNITFLGSKLFNTAEINGNLVMSDKSTVNGVDVSELSAKGVHLSTEEFINSSLIFSSNVTFLSPVTVTGEINNEVLSDVVYKNLPAVITGKKSFQQNVTFNGEMDVDGGINGVDISGNVLNTFSNQTITGEKTFKSHLTVQGDLSTTGSVDGVDVSEAYNDTVFFDTAQVITGYKAVKNITANDVIIDDCDHDCQLLRILESLSYKTVRQSNEKVHINGTVTFMNGLKVSNDITVANDVNGLILPSDLLLQNAAQSLYGENIFTNVTMNMNADNINKVNLTHIYQNAWRKDENVSITGIKKFLNDVTINGNLNVEGVIDDVNLQDVVLSSKNQTITGKKTFAAELYAKVLDVVSMTTHGLIDGVNLTYIDEELVRLSGDTIIKGTKVFTNHVSFAGNWTIPGLIDGVNITELDKNAMRLDGDQTVVALKTFSESVNVLDELTASKLVDGVNLTHLSKYSVKLNGEDTITFSENITFDHVTVQGNVTVNGLINDKNLTVIVADTLMKNGDQVVSGNHNITNLNVVENVVSQRVNSMEFSEEVVTLDRDSTISGETVFTSDFQTEYVQSESINNIDINTFATRLLSINKDAQITANMTLNGDLEVMKDIIVDGSINNVNLTYLTSTTLLKESNQTITLPTHFYDVTFMADVTNEELFNGINISHFSENVVYKCHGINKQITGKFTFNGTTVHGDTQVNKLKVNGSINDIDIEELQRTTVTLTGNHTMYGTKRITGSLITDDATAIKVNNFSIPHDFVTISGNDSITGYKEFLGDVHVSNDVVVSSLKTINGVDLSEFKSKIVSLNGNESVAGPVEFQNIVHINNKLNSDSINGVVISEDNLLLVDGAQNVTGPKIFTDVHSMKDIVSNNDIKGYSLLAMENETVISGKHNVITGYKTINGNVTILGDLQTNLVDDANVTNLFTGFNTISNFLDRNLLYLNESVATHTKIINELGNSIDNLHRDLDYFIQEQVLLFPYISISMDTFHTIDKTWLAVAALTDVDGASCSNFSIYEREIAANFTLHSNVVGNSIVDTMFMELDSELYLTAVSDRKHNGCFKIASSNPEASITYRLTDGVFQENSVIETSNAISIDIAVFNADSFSVIGNSHNGTSCLGQVLYYTTALSSIQIATIPKCNVVKSIILSVTDKVVTMATLSIDQYVDIYEVFRENSTFFLQQTIRTYHAKDIYHFLTDSGNFLAIANMYDSSSDALAVSYTVPVAVYRLIDGRYVKYQDLNVYSALLIKHFQIGVYHYLAISNNIQEIQFFKHKGVSKWIKVLTVPIAGSGSMKDIKIWEALGDVYLAVLTDNSEQQKHYPSKVRILKGQMTSSVEGIEIKNGL